MSDEQPKPAADVTRLTVHGVTCVRCAKPLTLATIEGSPQFFALAEGGAYYALAGEGENTEVFFACSVDCATLVQADPVACFMPPEQRVSKGGLIR